MVKNRLIRLSILMFTSLGLIMAFQNFTSVNYPAAKKIDSQGKLKLFLSPTGSDQIDSGTETKPALSLAHVQKIVQEAIEISSPALKQVEVSVAPGVYYGQGGLVWQALNNSITLRFVGSLTSPSVFDGRSNSGELKGSVYQFVKFDFSLAPAARVILENLTFQYYSEAISLEAKTFTRSDAKALGVTQLQSTLDERQSRGHRLENLKFNKIGSLYVKEAVSENMFGYEPRFDNADDTAFCSDVSQKNEAGFKEKCRLAHKAFAVVRLLNIGSSEFLRNSFEDIGNASGYGGLLHAYYVATNSSKNTFQYNQFVNLTGDPIRFRDFSNDNVITQSFFDRAGKAAISDWYCEQNLFTNNCKGAIAECPSWGNKFSNSFVYGSAENSVYVLPEWTTPEATAASACKRNYSTRHTARQVLKSNSVQPKASAQGLFFNISRLGLESDRRLVGVCKAANSCVSSTNFCYAHATTSGRWLCQNSDWNLCDVARAGTQSSGFGCVNAVVDSKYTMLWKKPLAGQILIKSQVGESNSYNYGWGYKPDQCISSGGFSYDTGKGTATAICDKTKWVSCDAGNLGKILYGKKCTKNSPSVYLWKLNNYLIR